MSATLTTEPATETPLDATLVLLNLIVTILAPMFLTAAGGDITYARMAATETIQAYRAQSNGDLILVAQIVAFSLAALSSLGLSMADDLSLRLILKLRDNAQSSSRAADRCRRAFADSQANPTPQPQDPDHSFNETTIRAGIRETQQRAIAAQTPHPEATQPQATQPTAPEPAAPLPQPVQPAAPKATAQKPAAQTSTQEAQNMQAIWAHAMSDVAAELAAEFETLPPAEREKARMQAAALTESANQLLSGKAAAQFPLFKR